MNITTQIRLIRDAVAEYADVTGHDLIGETRIERYAWPRMVAVYCCRKLCTHDCIFGRTFPLTDRLLAQEFHYSSISAIIKSVNKVRYEMESNPKVRADIELFIEFLRQKLESAETKTAAPEGRRPTERKRMNRGDRINRSK